jgi:acyl-CoA synthetase (AMP-forming)/AMP-acid ligase II
MTTEGIHGGISLLDILKEACLHSPASPAVVVNNDQNSDSQRASSLSYADIWECVELHQFWLKEKIDDFAWPKSGIRDIAIAYLSANSADMLVSMLACTSLNRWRTLPLNVALLNIRWSETEMAAALQSKSPSEAGTLILYGHGFEGAAEQVCHKMGHSSIFMEIPLIAKRYMKPIQKGVRSNSPMSRDSMLLDIQYLQQQVIPDDAMIVFTSGTTGGSKGVRLSHRAIAVQSAAKQMEPCRYSSSTAMLASTVPLYHIGGISSCISVLFACGTLIFSDAEPRFDPRRTILSLAHDVISTNTLVVVPAMLTALLKELGPSTLYPCVELILIGGQSAPKRMIDQLQRIFINARIVQTFACTEAASSLTFLHINAPTKQRQPTEFREKSTIISGDCVGSPPAHVFLRLYRKEDNTNKIVKLPYQPGVIATRGPHLMNGYWTRGLTPSDTRVTGWYLTSDLGFFDENGQWYFCGRARDTIRSGGETVMAQEVERVLLKHPSIVECAVFAKADDRFGEAVACALVTNTTLELDAIKIWCEQESLASYKRPRYIYLVDSLPRNSSGKVVKHLLVQRFGRIRSSL